MNTTVSPNAKIWIFFPDRIITKEENLLLMEEIHQFLKQWSSHGKPVESFLANPDNFFYVIAVDTTKNHIGGCAQDELNRFFKTLGSKYDIDFFNRFMIPVKNEQGNVELVNLKQIPAILPDNLLWANTLINQWKDLDKLYLPLQQHPLKNLILQNV
jgi:hypothetical protein